MRRLVRESLMHDGGRRDYAIHIPPTPTGGPRPLLLSLHGAGGSAEISARATGWADKADREGFVVAFPESTRLDPSRPVAFLSNPSFWNAGTGIGFPAAVDDVGFLRALVGVIKRRTPIDPDRVYAAGFSNGAAMAMRLAVEAPEEFAAIAAVAGHLWVRDRRPTPVPGLIYIAGDADPMSPWEGGRFTTPWGRKFTSPPVRETYELWASWLGPHERRIEARSDGVTLERFGPDAAGAKVHVHRIGGCGHVWPGGPAVLAERITGPLTDKLNATEVIWEFFSSCRRAARRDHGAAPA